MIKRGFFFKLSVNLSLISILSHWLSSSFWLNYPHMAVFLLLISICSNSNMWVRVGKKKKYKWTKSDVSEFKADTDWTGWGRLWWSLDYLVKYLIKLWPERHEVWWEYSWNAHYKVPQKFSPARWNNSTSTRWTGVKLGTPIQFQDNVSSWLWWNIFPFSATTRMTLRFRVKCLNNVFIKCM